MEGYKRHDVYEAAINYRNYALCPPCFRAFGNDIQDKYLEEDLAAEGKEGAIVLSSDECITRYDNGLGSSLQPTMDKNGHIAVPSDLISAIAELEKMLPQNLKDDIASNGARGQDFGLGEWIRNKWGLWDYGRSPELRRYFFARGIRDADEMSRFILDAYRGHLLRKPVSEPPLLAAGEIGSRYEIPEFLLKQRD